MFWLAPMALILKLCLGVTMCESCQHSAHCAPDALHRCHPTSSPYLPSRSRDAD